MLVATIFAAAMSSGVVAGGASPAAFSRMAAEQARLQVEGPSFRGTVAPTGTKRPESVVWWNDGSGILGAVSMQQGPTTKLAQQDTSMTCAYSMQFTVPDVAPGVYPVTVREAWSDGYSWYGEENFRVTG